jgi:streptomycin 6-kinase
VLSPALPPRFVRTVVDVHGQAGERWLSELPAQLATCAKRWCLHIGAPFELTYNYVAPAVAATGEEVVVKLSPPSNPELEPEATALRLAAGRGATRLLDADLSLGILLLERATPGTTLTALSLRDDAAATSAAATVMRRLWRPVPTDHPFPTIGRWARGFSRLRAAHDGGTGPLPESTVDAAEHLFAELSASATESVVLHGDLHHDNILAAEREPWLAIDPKGLVGEPAYEAGALLRNPYPQLLDAPDPGRLLSRRLDQLADELTLDRRRLHGWAYAQAVLSAVWSWEDHGAPTQFQRRCIELLEPSPQAGRRFLG